jgi:hypothetical protein
VCFDSKDKVLEIKKRRVFIQSKVYCMSSFNIKEIATEIKKQTQEYLVTENVRTKEQMQAYYDVKDKSQKLKERGFRLETSAFRTD